jgi:GT2 family glycosyltransferase
MKQVDVVIISWAKDEDLHKVTKTGLDTLFASESGNIQFHAYIVETNPEINYDEYNKPERRHTTTTIHPTVPFGYHRYLNIGVKAGKSPYVVLCNSDLTYEKGWASGIIAVMEAYPHIMSASPWCPQTQKSNQSHIGKIYEGWTVRGEIAGWCIFQQRSIYEKIGDLDENFEFWYCDNDYSCTLQLNGIKHVLVPHSVVNHHEKIVGKTAETLDAEEKERITEKQRAVFDKKWSRYFAPQ